MSENSTSTSFHAGDWFGVISSNVQVYLPPSEKARVASIWELVDHGADFDEVLDALISGGLRGLPAFALLSVADDAARVVLRGEVRAEFTVAGELIVLDGRDAATWLERALAGVSQSRLLLHEVDEVVAGLLRDGLVRVALVEHPATVEVRPLGTEPLDLTARPIEVEPVGFGSAPQFDAEVAAPQVVVPPVEPEPYADALSAPLAEIEGFAEPEPEPEPEPVAEPEEAAWIEAPLGSADPDVTDVLPQIDPDATGLMPAVPPLPPVPPLPVPEPPLPRNPVPGFPDLPEDEPVAAAPAEPNPWAPPSEAQPPAGFDHDGQTVTGNWDSSQFQRQHPGIPGQPPAPSVTAQPVAKLLLSSGDVVDVDRAILIGRAPEARRFTSTEQPRLVTVPSPNQEISSTHLEVRPGSGADHGTAVVSDLGSTNGTVLVLPGLAPEPLQPGVPVQLLPGSLIDLGDGLTIQVTSP
ncbi:FHA domain-containing protein [Nocardioides sp. Bht2]|uniref:FHA domain-containing protein n=1 Tax=Nocardioides sp. Bht2 TaxID=3392297 RepID=UPI0039B3ADA0